MKAIQIIARVLNEGSIIYKHNHDYFTFYKSEEDYDNEKEFMTQKVDEDFETFIQRLVDALMEEEQNSNEEMIVNIDYAIEM